MIYAKLQGIEILKELIVVMNVNLIFVEPVRKKNKIKLMAVIYSNL